MKDDMEASQEMPFVSLVHLGHRIQALLWIVTEEELGYEIWSTSYLNEFSKRKKYELISNCCSDG